MIQNIHNHIAGKNGEVTRNRNEKMKFIFGIVNTVQIILIILWTALCGILGMVLMLITWNGKWVHHVNGRYMWSPFVCLITGVRVKVQGLEKINKNKSFIYISNHESHFDILALSRVMPVGLFFIAKKELSRIPIMGQYMNFIGHIFVDRGNKENARKSMIIAADKIKAGKNVISFPEGTRSKTGEVQLFKRGAFMVAKEGAVDIVPIGIQGSREVLASGKFNIRPGIIYVRIGDVIQASTFTNMSIEQLADTCRQKVITLKATARQSS